MRAPVLIAAFLFTACNGDGPTDTEIPTYHADIRPILDQHCVRCHQDSGLGVGDWTNEEHVMAFAELMSARMASGEMPPPVSDPDCHDYVGSDFLALPDSAVETFAAWIEAGKPMGEASDDPGIVVAEIDLVDPDVTIMMAAPYTPVFNDAANPGNEYRCFLVDPGETEINVTAMDPVIGSPDLVHHVVMFPVDRDDITESMEDPAGWDCIDGQGTSNILAGWAPGMLPVEFPEGYSMTLGGDTALVLQMHYYQADPEDAGKADLSGYSFKTSVDSGREIYMAPVANYSFNIPAGDSAFSAGDRLRFSDLGVPVPLQIHAVFPHMHQLGSSYSMSIGHGDDTETCLVEGSYDFNNQLTYQFADRPTFGPGDYIDFQCTWDNSADNPYVTGEPVDTRFGERTDEEMCFFFTLVSIAE